MKTVDYDVLKTATPANADAARTLRMRGEGDIAPKLNADQRFWDESIPKTIPFPKAALLTSGTDFTGQRVGKLTVVGYLGPNVSKKSGKNTGGRWLVRCACGCHETRSSSSLRSGKDKGRCRRCDEISHIRRRAHFDAYGRWPDE